MDTEPSKQAPRQGPLPRAAGFDVETTSGELFVEAHPIRWVRDGQAGRPCVLLAHGAGAPLSSTFMQSTAEALVARGLSVVRFHFPYMERSVREGRRLPPNRAPLLLATCRAMVACVRSWLVNWAHASGAPRPPGLVVAGKSMGGRMFSMLLAAPDAPAVAGAVYLGYPLHPAGKPQAERREHLAGIGVPQLFISGTRDALASVDALRRVVTELGPRATLYLVEGGDHSLATKSPSVAWVDVMADFVHQTVGG